LEDPKSWKPGGGQVVLVRNERYWGVQPGPDRQVFKEISNDVAKQTAFRNGEVDVFEARPEQYDKMRREPDLMNRSKAFDWLSLNGGYRFVAWQQLRDGKPTRFADKRVRRAMAMLVDRKRLVQEVMLGYAELASGPFSPIGVQYDKSVKPLPYDVPAARKLLADARIRDKDDDGVLDGPDGKPGRFKFTYPSGSPNYEKMALAFKDAYAKAGIVLEPEPLEWSVFASKLRNKDFEAVSLGWGGGNPESDIYQMFDSSQTVVGGDNFMCYISPEFDAANRQARRTVDQKARVPLWHKCHQILNEDQPYMFLWFTKEMYFVDGRFHNVQPTPLGLTSSLHLEWFVPSDRQKWTK
jgi:peptide/nickel transport system substrate-binding protein